MANPFTIRHGHYHQAHTDPHPIKPKVISIPVHFVGPHDATTKRRAAAVTIQRIARGFLVRKNASVVRQVAKEVEEIERRLREEGAKMTHLNAKERLLVNEMLLALLLRLDSVRGVRDIRKKVIRRVIGLQEAIDEAEEQKDNDLYAQASMDHENAKDQSFDLGETNEAETELKMGFLGENESVEKQSDLEVAMESPAKNEILKDESRFGESEGEEVERKRREDGGIGEMVEKMAAENEALKEMVTKLCTTNSEQCRLMKGLVERVEKLERVVHHRMDRRKKRRSAK